ncbi:MAG: trigger factor [Spirochaetaceae bacterium]|jgi:trigger factor|nr:trigger factor [Spirochaetaceae bacterium]
MTVTKKITELKQSAVQLDITVRKEDIRSEYDSIITDATKNIRIPGFRPGKVPRNVLERKLGYTLLKEVKGRILELALATIFEDEEFPQSYRPLPYSTPEIDDETRDRTLNLDEDLTFSVHYDVMPSVHVEKWTGFEVEVPEIKISDEDINQEIEILRERNAAVFDKDEQAPAQKGDVVTVDYGEIDSAGKFIENTMRKDYVWTLGTGRNVYELDDALIGMKRGEIREIEKNYPQDFENTALAGQTKKIRVIMNNIKEKTLPVLDDEFAKDMGEQYNTLDELRNTIKSRLEKERDAAIHTFKINSIFEKIIAITPIELPESMIRIQLQTQWRNLTNQMDVPVDGEIIEEYGAEKDPWKKDLMKLWRPGVIKTLHSGLIATAIARQLSLEVSDEELQHEIERIAQERKSVEIEELTAYYEQESRKELLKEDIKERKLFDIILKENIFKTGQEQNFLEFTGKNK